MPWESSYVTLKLIKQAPWAGQHQAIFGLQAKNNLPSLAGQEVFIYSKGKMVSSWKCHNCAGKRKNTEIRERLKGAAFRAALVEQEQNTKSKSKENCKSLCANITLCAGFLWQSQCDTQLAKVSGPVSFCTLNWIQPQYRGVVLPFPWNLASLSAAELIIN